MNKPSVESYIKNRLESRRIEPSKSVWEQLDRELSSQRLKRKKQKQFYWAIAGFMLLFGMLSPPEKTANPHPINANTKQKFPWDPQSKSEHRYKEVAILTSLKKTNALLPLTPLPFASPVKTVPQKTEHFSNEIPPSTDDRFIEIETEEWLKKAHDDLQKIKKQDSLNELQALRLLIATENELYNETQLKTKVFDFIRNGYTKLSLATNESVKQPL